MKLSEAIRLNGMAKPQGYGDESIKSIDAPCALGGALQAAGMQQCEYHYNTIKRLWPVTTLAAECPLGCKQPYVDQVIHVIWHLNDGHRWTRQQIADWVETVEPQELQAEVIEHESVAV